MKTIELENAALDWAVAKCEGHNQTSRWMEIFTYQNSHKKGYNYSSDWSQGGAIIEREGMSLEFRPMGSMHEWVAFNDDVFAGGETPLIAAMRCYVAYKLGYEVDIPQELTEQQEAIK